MAKRKSSVTADPPAPPVDEAAAPEGYTVLARRYRPQQFRDVVGQEPVARALVNALEGNRVAHAYLFTGARGVGKTSTARILAKALNCARGPTATPCDECDICRSIASGDDVDVLEIDGASNRGIDEVRELRRNVGFRPSRSRYKIYIIDEVHMLTKEAFNALLKTLEEPPPHVKFIFATTEVQKIPVTILSRCQRFDFAGIGTPRIVERLREVVKGEGMGADDDALEWVARRAGGSMRDAQSLLDQLLAFGGEPGQNRLTLEQVHRLLGTAGDDRVVALAGAVLAHDARQALELLGQAADEGLQLGELLDQLIEYWRDLMVVSCAGVEGRDLSVGPRHRDTLAKQAAGLTVDTVLAGLDVLATTKARLRGSGHGRVLLEMALVRLSRLENLVSLSQLTDLLSRCDAAPRRAAPPTPAAPVAGAAKARSAVPHLPETPAPRRQPAAAEEPAATELTEESLPAVWPHVLAQIGPLYAASLKKADFPAISGPNTLVFRFPPEYNVEREHCQEPARASQVENALKKLTGKPWNVRFEAVPGATAAAPPPAADADKTPSRYRRQRAEASQEPLVKRAIEQLGAQIVQVDDGFGAAPSEPAERPAPETDTEES